MKTLLLHNDNVNVSFEQLFDVVEKITPSFSEMLKEEFDLDTFLDARLAKILDQSFDCIYLPFTFSNDDYLQFTGLLIASHIRLSPDQKHTHVPIVFVGPDSPGHVYKLNIMGSLLFTSGIYFLVSQQANAKEELEKRIEINGNITDEGYRSFLERLQVDPPSNYASYHSLANEWGIKKMADLFERSVIKQALLSEIQKVEERFKTKLYFKFLEAKLDGARTKIAKKDKILPTIPGVDGPKVVYIDDEYDKGWELLFEHIFSVSGPKPISFKPFKKESKREDLFNEITAFLEKPETKDADIYIVDLRLCDQDIKEKDNSLLTGMQLLKYLTDKNPGNQVMIFTASNKTWNLNKALELGACGYVIKESPELNYSADQTKLLFKEFQRGIQRANRKSYLKKFWEFIVIAKRSGKATAITESNFADKLLGNGGWLDQLFTLLNLDNSVVYRQVLVTFISILEAYADTAFEDGSEMVVKLSKGGTQIVRNSLGKRIFDFEYGNYPFHIDPNAKVRTGVVFHSSLHTIKVDHEVTSLMVKLVTTLHYNYNFSSARLSYIMELVFLRNNLAAHGSENKVNELKRSITIDDVTKIIAILEAMFG